MRKTDNFVNLYSVSKTLRFKAIPVGKTQENIEIKRLIEEDEERAEKYKRAKKIMDRYHRDFIDRVLGNICLEGLDEYAELFYKKDRNDADKIRLIKIEEILRKQISNALKNDKEFPKMFVKDMVKKVLPQYLTDEEEKKIIESFVGFYTAFSGFNANRMNMYSDEAKSTAISYRCINENLPRYLSNMKCFGVIKDVLGTDIINEINKEMGMDPYSLEDCFSLDFYNLLLTGKGIRVYNTFIGGFTGENGTKIKGLNEYINRYNQQPGKEEKAKRLPKMKQLYKQMLSDDEGTSFHIEEYEKDSEVIKDIKAATGIESPIYKTLEIIRELFGRMGEFSSDGIYVQNGLPITSISKDITGDWAAVQNVWNRKYDDENMKKPPRNMEKYEEKRKKAYKAIDSFSFKELDELLSLVILDGDNKVVSMSDYFGKRISELLENIKSAFDEIAPILDVDYPEDRRLASDKETVAYIKAYLDSIKTLESFIKPLQGSGKENGREETFYGEYTECFDVLRNVDRLYDRVRNYVTKKFYSTDKFKLYFQKPKFMDGWDINKEKDNLAAILRRNSYYYLAVIDKTDSAALLTDKYGDETDCYEKLIYKQINDAKKYLSSKQILPQNPPENIKRILKEKKESGKLNKEDTVSFINYLINDFLKTYNMIIDNSGNCYFNFSFKEANAYVDLKEFFDDVDKQAYSLRMEKISRKYIDELVENGSIYLFKIYNKDFSRHSHGRKNLHTLYFEQLFNKDNEGSIKLCGGAELFFRRASIKPDERIIHKAGEAIENKNPLNSKKESTFSYDIVKNRRFTTDQYEIHIPIVLNRMPEGGIRINEAVRLALRNDENPYIIGIDRGERNLLYICVIDGTGRIVEQFSLNEIINEHKNIKIRTDYHALLNEKEKGRLKARQEWSDIENIKELKEGYISQVIHKICELVVKYDAVIAMEDLNSGFKNSRVRVEKSVYQKFEKALIDKLNYLVDKLIPLEKNGSVVKGYQLANPFQGFKTMGTQNGFIFYIPAWLTSKIDPVTGFADLLKPKYINIEKSREFIGRFDSIKYNAGEDLFEFETDYSKFERTDADYRKKWIICSYGSRIETYRNSEKNSEWDSRTVDVTAEFKKLLSDYSIDYKSGDLRERLCGIGEKDFYKEFIRLVRLMLQMRNSESGRTDVDYLISPVRNKDGVFYNSNNAGADLPQDADANGAYNIARKVLWAIDRFKLVSEEDVSKVKIAISNKEWLEYAQK